MKPRDELIARYDPLAVWDGTNNRGIVTNAYAQYLRSAVRQPARYPLDQLVFAYRHIQKNRR
jgi:hypothetical protein